MSTLEKAPLVSIITANYNKADYIGQTHASVNTQSYKDWEWIIVDDCSTDLSLSVIDPFLADERIRLIRNRTNKGGNFCRNLGLGQATGEYIIFLDADDLLAANCLKKRVEAAIQYPTCNLLVFTMGVFRSAPGDMSQDWIPHSKHPLKDILQHDLPWSILQPLWKKNFLAQLGGFDESFLRLQDVELNTRALLHKNVNYKLFATNPDCYYRVDEARKNYDAAVFLGRWVDSALKYCDKMKELVSPHLASFLWGTIYQTYFQVIYHYRQQLISQSEFENFEYRLLDLESFRSSRFMKRSLFRLSKWYNLYCFRIPGFNRFLRSCIIL